MQSNLQNKDTTSKPRVEKAKEKGEEEEKEENINNDDKEWKEEKGKHWQESEPALCAGGLPENTMIEKSQKRDGGTDTQLWLSPEETKAGVS